MKWVRQLPGGVGLLVLAAVMTSCQDTIVKPLQAVNDEQVILTPDNFQFTAVDLDNVHDRRVYNWSHSGTVATVNHRSFIHHGLGVITVQDAVGDTVYNEIHLEWELDSETEAGVPGLWRVSISFYGAKGRADVRLLKGP